MFKLLDDHKAINKGITSIKVRGRNLDLLIWQVAASATVHSVQHNECSTLDRLYNSMPNGSRRERLAAWVVDNSGITLYKGKAEGRVFSVKEGASAATEALLTQPWYEHAREVDNDKPQWNFHASLERMLKRAEREAAQGNSTVDSAALEALSALLPTEQDKE